MTETHADIGHGWTTGETLHREDLITTIVIMVKTGVEATIEGYLSREQQLAGWTSDHLDDKGTQRVMSEEVMDARAQTHDMATVEGASANRAASLEGTSTR